MHGTTRQCFVNGDPSVKEAKSNILEASILVGSGRETARSPMPRTSTTVRPFELEHICGLHVS